MTLLEKAKEFYAKNAFNGDGTVQMWMADFAKEQMPKWTYCADAMPTKDKCYWVTFKPNDDGVSHGNCEFADGAFRPIGINVTLYVLAWMTFPKPAEPPPLDK